MSPRRVCLAHHHATVQAADFARPGSRLLVLSKADGNEVGLQSSTKLDTSAEYQYNQQALTTSKPSGGQSVRVPQQGYSPYTARVLPSPRTGTVSNLPSCLHHTYDKPKVIVKASSAARCHLSGIEIWKSRGVKNSVPCAAPTAQHPQRRCTGVLSVSRSSVFGSCHSHQTNATSIHTTLHWSKLVSPLVRR